MIPAMFVVLAISALACGMVLGAWMVLLTRGSSSHSSSRKQLNGVLTLLVFGVPGGFALNYLVDVELGAYAAVTGVIPFGISAIAGAILEWQNSS